MMKIRRISLHKFKRFESLTVDGIPQTAKLVVLTGPNGSGKSSLFEGFNFWARNKRGNSFFDQDYHSRDTIGHHRYLIQSTNIEFHDFSPSVNQAENVTCFYIRSAYRHEADFTSSGIGTIPDATDSVNRLHSLMHQEQRISENYARIVGEAVRELFNGQEPTKTKEQIRDRLIGEIRQAMTVLFDGLVLSGAGNPTSGGTFRFNKGTISEFHFKNLSGGEKAAFDLLLDFIVKKETFDNTVFCIRPVAKVA